MTQIESNRVRDGKLLQKMLRFWIFIHLCNARCFVYSFKFEWTNKHQRSMSFNHKLCDDVFVQHGPLFPNSNGIIQVANSKQI